MSRAKSEEEQKYAKGENEDNNSFPIWQFLGGTVFFFVLIAIVVALYYHFIIKRGSQNFHVHGTDRCELEWRLIRADLLKFEAVREQMEDNLVNARSWGTRKKAITKKLSEIFTDVQSKNSQCKEYLLKSVNKFIREKIKLSIKTDDFYEGDGVRPLGLSDISETNISELGGNTPPTHEVNQTPTKRPVNIVGSSFKFHDDHHYSPSYNINDRSFINRYQLLQHLTPKLPDENTNVDRRIEIAEKATAELNRINDTAATL